MTVYEFGDTAASPDAQSDPYEAGLAEIEQVIYGDQLAPLVDIAEELIRINPDRGEAYGVLGLVANASDDMGRAVQMFEAAHGHDPECREYAEALASLNVRVGKLSDGLFYAKLATTMDDNLRFRAWMPADLLNFARSLLIAGRSVYHLQAQEFFEQRQYTQAAEYCRRHLQLERNDSDTFRLLGASNIQIGDFQQAVSAFHAAIHINPEEALSYAYLGVALNNLGRDGEALACFKRAKALSPDDPVVHGKVMSGLATLPDEAWPHFKKIGAAWSRKSVTSRKKRTGHKFDPAQGRRIRVGYISANFNQASSEVPFIETLLASHDRSRFEIFGYQTFPIDDPMTVRLQNLCDVWVRLKDIDPYTGALIIENDQCDVLVDLTGFGDDNRIDILARRPAPVQIAWSTRGEAAFAPGADYILSDPVLIDADRKMCPKGQEPLVLEKGSAALMPFRMVGDVAPAPVLTNKSITFGAVADLSAISLDCVELWCRVLDAVPGSRIAFGFTERLTSSTRDQILEWFSHMGMVDRVLFHVTEHQPEAGPGLTPYREDFFSTVDVLLDSMPISNAIAIASGLWMGVPAVSMLADRRSACLGGSVLTSAGFPQWVASTEDEYVDVVKQLVADAGVLSAVRETLRTDVGKSALFDAAGFARRVESAYASVLNK